MEALEDLTEKAAEVVLEAGALDVLIADTPVKKKDVMGGKKLIPGSNRGGDKNCWTNAT